VPAVYCLLFTVYYIHDPTQPTLSDEAFPKELFSSRLLDASVDGILAFDRDCRYTAWNRAMERISGKKSADTLGRNAFEIFPFLKETGEDKCFYEALAGKSSVSENRPYTIPETGREGFFRGFYSPLYDEHNEIAGGIAIIRDITERKRAEAEAEEAHQRLTFHVENSPLAVIEWDSDFRVSRWSESAERLFGWAPEEVLGKHVGDWHFVFDEDVDAVEQLTNRQRLGAEFLGVQRNRNYTRGGSVLYCEWYNSVLRNESGRLISVLSLVLDVTARKRAEEERTQLLVREREARKQSEDADRLKDEFLATLSHELRTPLTSILGWATLLRAGEVEEGNIARAVETIERNARSQARLIDDLLDVSRIITGNLRLDLRPINLAPIVETASDALRPTADAKNIQLITKFDSETCLVKGDPNRLRQVIWNLLMNAIKFTPRGGSVSVHLGCVRQGQSSDVQSRTSDFQSRTSDVQNRTSDIQSQSEIRNPKSEISPSSYVRLSVSDTGEGIAESFLPFVFDRFRQAEGSISRKQGGLGLGLAVARHLVELHGGNIRVESEGPQQGSTFIVELPLAEERRDPARRQERRREVERRSNVSTVPGLDGIRVLLVEDDEDSRKLLGLMLKKQGAEVTSTSSSAEALGAIEEIFDVILSDIGMADEDGYELIRKVRALPAERGGLTPAIALTGYATRKDRERALSVGYQLHLAKPVEPPDLVAAIASLSRKGSQQ
jgi:PAS domain S-box-containing protein